MSTKPAPAQAAPAAPDNTQPTCPPPGAGSWHWDAATAQWVDNYATPAQPTTPAQE